MMRRSLVPDVPATLAQCARVYCSRAAHVLPSFPALCCLINYVNITFRETLLTTPKNVAPSPGLAVAFFFVAHLWKLICN